MTITHQNTVDRGALVADLANMVRIPSVNNFGKEIIGAPPEEAMGKYLEKRMLELGLEVEKSEPILYNIHSGPVY